MRESGQILADINAARLIAQCDINNGITQVINYDFDPTLDLPVPTSWPMARTKAFSTVLRVTTDAFAQGDNRLVNHKTYYFMALAYGYNNYRRYDRGAGTGQDVQFKASRKAAVGSIRLTAAFLTTLPLRLAARFSMRNTAAAS